MIWCFVYYGLLHLFRLFCVLFFCGKYPGCEISSCFQPLNAFARKEWYTIVYVWVRVCTNFQAGPPYKRYTHDYRYLCSICDSFVLCKTPSSTLCSSDGDGGKCSVQKIPPFSSSVIHLLSTSFMSNKKKQNLLHNFWMQIFVVPFFHALYYLFLAI